ncbi:MAG: menaquinone biosynthesis protein [Candidatus Nitrohelix vancouverensis]|uniref:Chorismate dehydratase n=1 Tax=Candidatus Nitrohelix vancouverensis TaxID=2705534 RepID=A0A7T0C0V0_9BACT|nr:MAG: menaquinone biosynthesis protein [Candidatus Nitrohelix vancouverensis]
MTRLGIHDFLNAQPLLQPLREQAKALNLSIHTAPPAQLADQLKAGELDLAMIPSIEYLRNADRYRLVPGPCIASKGRVDTVLLISKGPLDQIHSVAADQRSRTSIAALELLFGERFAPGWSLQAMQPDLNAMMQDCDAALIIGDPTFSLDIKAPLVAHDLSLEWQQRTRLPFVHAVFAVRNGVTLSYELLQALARAAQNSAATAERIANDYAVGDYKNPQRFQDYLTNKIRYILGEEEIQGMQTFRDLCAAANILPHAHDLTFTGLAG